MKNQPMRILLLVIIGYKLDVKLTAILLLYKGNARFFCLRSVISPSNNLSSERYKVHRR
jgi:hypothetical protein